VAKRRLEDQLAGRTPVVAAEGQPIDAAVDVSIQDKKNQGITAKLIGKYTRDLARFKEFCELRSVCTVQGVTRELLTGYCATWEDNYPASLTRSKVRERLRSFLRFCYQAEWLSRWKVEQKSAIV
jgi:integrase/recombinase XerD